jgi:hypothetical protein
MNEYDSNLLNNIFTYLVDSVSYINDMESKKDQITDINKKLKEEKSNIELLKSKISELMDNYSNDHKDFLSYKEKIDNYIATSIDQFFSLMSNETVSSIADITKKIENDIKYAIENVKLFLINNPLKILEKSIKIKNDNNSLLSIALYKCVLNIEYEFLLKNTDLGFTQNPHFLTLTPGIKLPVKLSENGEILYEKLDMYSLYNAELLDNNMVAEFRDNNKSFKFEYLINNSIKLILYSADNNTTDLISDKNLMNNINMDLIANAMKKLYKVFIDLENTKIQLLSLKMDGVDLIENTLFDKLLCKLIESDYVKNIVRELPEKSNETSVITKELIKNRINTIGNNCDKLNNTLFD